MNSQSSRPALDRASTPAPPLQLPGLSPSDLHTFAPTEDRQVAAYLDRLRRRPGVAALLATWPAGVEALLVDAFAHGFEYGYWLAQDAATDDCLLAVQAVQRQHPAGAAALTAVRGQLEAARHDLWRTGPFADTATAPARPGA